MPLPEHRWLFAAFVVIYVSVTWLAGWTFATDPETIAKASNRFGQSPLGLPAHAVVCALFAIVFANILVFIWHLLALTWAMAEIEGKTRVACGYPGVIRLWVASWPHRSYPVVRHNLNVSMATLLFIVASLVMLLVTTDRPPN